MSRLDAIFSDVLDDLQAKGLRRLIAPAAVAKIDVSSNDYMGLARHPLLIGRAREWAASHGTGARASRLVVGTLELHERVEAKLARLKGTEAALLFASGWQANAGVLAALLRLPGPAPLVFTDRLIHASLHHGCAAAGVPQIRFRHNDLAHLVKLLEASAARPGRRFIVTESVFSMDGDRADVPALAEIAGRFGAFLYLDEAHATGVLGRGGMGLSCGVAGVDLVMGTFSKALGGFGAYVAGSRALCDWLVNACSGFIHTTALPPPMLGAIDAALDLVPGMDEARARLMQSAARVRGALAEAGIDTGESSTQIVPAIVGGEREALGWAAALRERGVLAIAIRPPTVPRGTSRLRLGLSAGHSDADIGMLIDALVATRPLERRAAAQERPKPRGVFVTGTDTGVGKTVVAACLAKRLGADYWKPAQTGVADGDDDTATVLALAGLAGDRVHAPRHRFMAPLSPEAAAALEGESVGLGDFVLPRSARPLVVEGAGGVLVPLGGGATMADLMRRLGLPAVLVARSTLGTINHTLMSLEALRGRGVVVAGVVLVGPPNAGNRADIERHGRVRVLAELPWVEVRWMLAVSKH